MSEKQEIITISGRQYDKHTGMPIIASDKKPATPSHDAQTVHQHISKSHTLNRHYVKRPEHLQHQPAKKIEITDKEYPAISRFASHTSHTKTVHSASQPTSRIVQDIAPGVHPMVQRVEAARAASSAPRVAKPSEVLKKEAIEAALANAPQHSKRHRTKDHSRTDKQIKTRRRLSLATGGLAILLIGAYFTYITMPTLSVKVAAAQAGVNASYPAYHPSGYSLSGAVAFQPGSVSMRFAQNGGKDGFTLTQSNSGWDSSALKNSVATKSNSDYAISQYNGLTIYTYGDNAAWVSGGILYTIQGDATLSTDQIQHIATSM